MRNYENSKPAIKINNLIVAVVLMSTTLSQTLSLAFGITKGANGYVVLAVFSLFVIRLFYVKNKKDIYKIDSFSIILIIMVLLLFILTEVFAVDASRYSLVHLAFYAIMPICCINLNLDTEAVLRYGLYLSLFTVLAGNEWFESQYIFLNQANMGSIYPIVTMLIIALFHFKFYRKSAKKLVKICYIYNLYMLARTLMVANRGAAFAILFCAFIISIYKFNSEKRLVLASWKFVTIIVVLVVVIMFLVANMLDVLEFIEKASYKLFNKVPSVILKMKMYATEDNIMNGRLELYEYTWQEIKKSPLYGYGISTFYVHSNGKYIYPHNFVLQYLFEGGILFATIPTVLAAKLLFEVLFGKIVNKSEFILAAMLVCQCIPKLLFSTDAWFNTNLWMMIAFSAMRIKKAPLKIDLKKIIEKAHTE